MINYKIVRYKDFGNWFVFKRYLIFFWGQETYFLGGTKGLENSINYVFKRNGFKQFIVQDNEEYVKTKKPSFSYSC